MQEDKIKFYKNFVQIGWIECRSVRIEYINSKFQTHTQNHQHTQKLGLGESTTIVAIKFQGSLAIIHGITTSK